MADKLLRWSQLDLVTINKKDSQGNRLPFHLVYCKKDGGIIDQDNVVCTSVDHAKGTRRVKFLDTDDGCGNAETRTLRDVLIIKIDDHKIIKN